MGNGKNHEPKYPRITFASAGRSLFAKLRSIRARRLSSCSARNLKFAARVATIFSTQLTHLRWGLLPVSFILRQRSTNTSLVHASPV